MQKVSKTILSISMAIFGLFALTSLIASEPTYAAADCDKAHFVESSIIGSDYTIDGDANNIKHGYCDDGEGGGVYHIISIILTILTFGVGIAATAGLVICGIQYATSGTNEAKATQARRRIFEIVIGLIAYAVMYLALQWLIPGFST